MPVLGTCLPDELTRYIEAAGESANIDAKAPMAWDSGEASASLTKDIIALANCRDGGVIVLGKEESKSKQGQFVLVGLSEPQAASFETTKVATWVNNHCEPAVTLVCHRHEHQGRAFVVITVAEFQDVPVICTKQFEQSGAGKGTKVLLRKGAIYVRTPNAESAPLSSAEDMRPLIGLATTKRTDQMLAMFQAMMKGRPLIEPQPAVDLFGPEREEVQATLATELEGQVGRGAWTFVCHPAQHRPDRWSDATTLRKVIEKSAVRLYRGFPPYSRDTHVREWGICDRMFEDAFGLTHSGLFVANRLFREDGLEYRSPWQPGPDFAAGQWLDFKLNLSVVIEFFLFLSRFAENFEVGEEIVYELSAQPLAGKRLVTMDGNINLDPTEPCRASRFRRTGKVTLEALRASWEERCAKTMHDFFEFFPGTAISQETMKAWIERAKERKF